MRSWLVVLAVALVVVTTAALSVGLPASTASATTSTTTSTVVSDQATNLGWAGTEVTGATAYDTATVAGDLTQVPTGTVTYSFFDNGTCTVDSNTTTDTEPVSAGIAQNSAAQGPLAAGTYSFDATYGGDTYNSPSGPSPCEPFSVATATPSVSLTVLDSSDQPWTNGQTGAEAGASSTVTGVSGFTPVGSVTYSFFDNGTCTVDGNTTTETQSLSGGVVPNATPSGPLGAGSFSFKASYSGDGNYAAASSSCENFAVDMSIPTVTTTVQNSSDQAWTGGSSGSSAHDSATVTGVGGFTPGGSVTYSFFDNGTCTVDGNTTTDLQLLSAGVVPNSAPSGPLGAGSFSFEASYSGDTNYGAASSSCETFTVNRAAATTSTVAFDAASNTTWAGTEVTGASAYDTATVTGVAGVTPTGNVAYAFFANDACTGSGTSAGTKALASGSLPQSDTMGPLAAGNYSFDATYSGDGNYIGFSSGCEPFTVGVATVTTSTKAFDAATDAPWSGMETATARAYDTATVTGAPGILPTGTVTYTFFTGSGSCTGTSTPVGTVTVSGGTVPQSTTTGHLGVGAYSFQSSYSGDTSYAPSTSSCEGFNVALGPPNPPTIGNIPGSPVYGGGFVASVTTNSDGSSSVTSSTTGVCTANGTGVKFVGVGRCALTAHTSSTVNFEASNGAAQSFTVAWATPTSPTVTNIPSDPTEFGTFVASVFTTGDGVTSVTSISAAVCTVGGDGHTVTFVGFGVCTLTASVAQGTHFFGATGNPQSFPVGPAARGYWLVGSDGGIFSFGAASFYGSMGSTPLQRPVVGITPSASRTGYWLVASDGGIFSFGTSDYYGSIPAVGLHPAGSGLPNSLNAPIVGMVPSVTGHGYFMIASDGGVFAFGDARFAGSCPGIGGCAGKAVSVMPDSTGNGYWLVTNLGAVYAFGDALFYGAPVRRRCRSSTRWPRRTGGATGCSTPTAWSIPLVMRPAWATHSGT